MAAIVRGIVLILLLLVLTGCGGPTSGHGLVIEFYDCADVGLSGAEATDDSMVAGEDFSAEPLLVVREDDIESWPEFTGETWSPEDGYIELVEGEATSGLALLAEAESDVDLMFRLTVDGQSFWGTIRYGLASGSLSPQCVHLGYPLIMFPGGHVGLFDSFYLASGGITVDGVDLADAARQAWSDSQAVQ